MKEDKKKWFLAVSFNLWIPISIEGWLLTAVSLFVFYGIFKFNHISREIPFSFSQHWPFLLELLVALGGFYFITSGHVKKTRD